MKAELATGGACEIIKNHRFHSSKKKKIHLYILFIILKMFMNKFIRKKTF